MTIVPTNTNLMSNTMYLVGGCCIGSWCSDRVRCCVVVVDELIMFRKIHCIGSLIHSIPIMLPVRHCEHWEW